MSRFLCRTLSGTLRLRSKLPTDPEAAKRIEDTEQASDYLFDYPDTQADDLLLCCQRGNLEHIQELLKGGVSVNTKGPGNATPLHRAASFNHPDVVLALLKAGADVTSVAINRTPLHVAAQQGHVAVVQALLGAVGKCDPDIKAGK